MYTCIVVSDRVFSLVKHHTLVKWLLNCPDYWSGQIKFWRGVTMSHLGFTSFRNQIARSQVDPHEQSRFCGVIQSREMAVQWLFSYENHLQAK